MSRLTIRKEGKRMRAKYARNEAEEEGEGKGREMRTRAEEEG